MKAAMIDALCTPMVPMLILSWYIHRWWWYWSCMLLLHPTPSCTDNAGPKLCILCSDICNLHLWCFPYNYIGTNTPLTLSGCHHLQLGMLVFCIQPSIGINSLAHVMVSPTATCAGGVCSPYAGIDAVLAVVGVSSSVMIYVIYPDCMHAWHLTRQVIVSIMFILCLQ